MPTTLFPYGMKSGTPTALGDEQGAVTLIQQALMVQNSTTAVTATLKVPAGRVIDVWFDQRVAWNSAVSATGTVGFAAAGTDIASGVDVKVAGRTRPTFTGAQITAMVLTAPTTLYFTVTPSGATSAGTTRAVVLYEAA